MSVFCTVTNPTKRRRIVFAGPDGHIRMEYAPNETALDQEWPEHLVDQVQRTAAKVGHNEELVVEVTPPPAGAVSRSEPNDDGLTASGARRRRGARDPE